LEKDIIRVMGCRGNVARMGEMRKMRMEDRNVNGRIILKWMLSNAVK
jgi:hypothetical protein